MANQDKRNSVSFQIENGQMESGPTAANSESVLISQRSQISFPLVVGWWKNYHRDTSPKIACDNDGEYQCIKNRQSPPPDDIEISTSMESCTSAVCHLKISKNSLKQRILECMKVTNASFIPHLEDIEKGRMTDEDAEKIFSKSTTTERNIAFLSAALHGRLNILKILFENKADLHFSEPTEGFTALHFSAFSDDVNCATYLIDSGADVNYAPEKYTPLETACFHNSFKVAKLLLDKGAKVNSVRETGCTEQNYKSTPLHSAVKANAIECVQLLLSEGASHTKPKESECYSPLHVAAEMGHLQCLRILSDSGTDLNMVTPDTKSTALHLAADGGFNECVSFLLSKGAKAEVRNAKGQTPLHLAARAQSVECVELLLEVGHCNPNFVDADKRSPLHSSVGKAMNSSDITQLLITKGANVNLADIYGYTPLHVAALNDNTACVQILINNGANVTKKTKGGNTALGIIIRKTPLALPVLYKKLDTSIIVHDPEVTSSKEVVMKLDFRILLQQCQRGEMDFLKTFLDEGQKDILEHPLSQAFLHVKWEKIRKYFIARLIFYLLLVVFLTTYVFVTFVHCGMTPDYYSAKIPNENFTNCSEEIPGYETYEYGEIFVNSTDASSACLNVTRFLKCDNNKRMTRNGLWVVLIVFTIIEGLRKAYALTSCSSLRHYILHIDNIVEWFVLISNFLISRAYIGPNHWQNQLGAFAVLFAWINLMLLIGQTPVFGSYVAMYIKVQKQFAMIFVAYVSLLIGFTLSFCVVFNSEQNFENPLIGFIQIIAFMIGALDYKDLMFEDERSYGISAHLIFFIFMLFVTIIMWNLLIGIAVRDIQGLEKTAGISRLVRLTKLISSIEFSLFNSWLPRYVLTFLRHTALIAPSGYRVVLQVKPLNHHEQRLPKTILQHAYEIAKAGKRGVRSPSVTSRILSFIGSKQDSSSELLPDSANVQKLQCEVEASNVAISRLTEEIQELKELIRNKCK